MNAAALTDQDMIRLENVSKMFTLHLRGGTMMPAVAGLSLIVRQGECVALDGPSGAGKSSVLKMIFGSYLTSSGRVLVRRQKTFVDVAHANPREIIELRRHSISYVSQFLRVIPRISCIDLVTAAARDDGCSPSAAQERASSLLARLNLPERLWSLPPATFSGGEQQRVNIARGFATQRPILLLDEPTASLDRANTEAVLDLIADRKAQGVAILGVFHDPDVRSRVADRLAPMGRVDGASHEHFAH
jgi:alpha-D-ribose 1-methylphosphonate 5-triphosphate synthase subunit PhnL